MNWPSELEGFFSAVTIIGESQKSMISFDCFVKENTSFTNDTSSLFYLKVLMAGLLPILMLIFFAIMWAPVGYKFYSMYFYKRALVVNMICILFLLHPTIMELSF